MLSWNQTHVNIDYLGPVDSNPYNVGPEGYLAPSKPVQKGAAPKSLSGTISTDIFQERTETISIASSSSNVDFRQILNAMSSDNVRWLQVGLVYDTQTLFGTSPSWRVLYNSWFISSTTNEFAVVSPDMAIGPNDPIEFTIKANSATAGRYTMTFFDSLFLRGHSYSFTASNDSGHNINLGQRTNLSGVVFPSGPMVEEYSDSGTGKYDFGTQDYDLYFLETSTSSETTAVSGWHTSSGTCASVTTGNSPAGALFSYTC